MLSFESASSPKSMNVHFFSHFVEWLPCLQCMWDEVDRGRFGKDVGLRRRSRSPCFEHLREEGPFVPCKMGGGEPPSEGQRFLPWHTFVLRFLGTPILPFLPRTDSLLFFVHIEVLDRPPPFHSVGTRTELGFHRGWLFGRSRVSNPMGFPFEPVPPLLISWTDRSHTDMDTCARGSRKPPMRPLGRLYGITWTPRGVPRVPWVRAGGLGGGADGVSRTWDAWLDRRREEYYLEGRSKVSDDAYDAVEQKRREAKDPNTWKERVGAPPPADGKDGSRKRVSHWPPMLSLTSVRTQGELMEWKERLAGIDPQTDQKWMVEPKVDGVALRLLYSEGKLVEAATRGDGTRGEDVTRSVRKRMQVPWQIKVNGAQKERAQLLDVRGEAFLTKKDFTSINEKRAQRKELPFAHARNAISGALRRLDDDEEIQTAHTKEGGETHIPEEDFVDEHGQPLLRFSAYALYLNGSPGAPTQAEILHVLHELGFHVSPGIVCCTSFEEAVEAAKEWMASRESIAFDVDGVVIKLNDLEAAGMLGSTTTAPRGSVAWKFAARETVTTLLDVCYTVGRTGRVVPNAVLEPVELAGARIQHATLHNFKRLEDLDIRVGDQVVVKRAGDVIPQVVQVLHELRTGREFAVTAPDSCPSCGEKLVRLDGEELHRCINNQCSAQQQRRLEHFVDTCVDGVGKGVIQDLLREGLVRDVADLYKLDAQQLEVLPGYGSRSVGLILRALEESKNPELTVFLTALGIRYVGGQVSRLLASHFSTVEALQAASVAELSTVHGVGHVTAESLWEWFQSSANQALLKKLHSVGFLPCRVATEGTIDEQRRNFSFQGLSVVLTGTLQSFTRDQARKLVEQRGGLTRSSVSRDTDLVVAGKKPGIKLENAKRFNLRILSEEEFLELLQEGQ